MADGWATGLPKKFIISVLDRLFLMSDYVRFSAVCKSWHSAALNQRQSRLKSCNKQLPMLMIPTKDNSEEERSLYGIEEGGGKLYNFKLRVPFNKRCCGSSYGWLATVEKNYGITLLNPFSGGKICLPPIVEETLGLGFGDEYPSVVKKVIFSQNPSLSPNDFMVVAIFSGYYSLAFIRPGMMEGWTIIKDQLRTDFKNFPVSDIFFYKDRLYAVEQNGGTFSINFDRQSSGTCEFKLKLVIPKPRYNGVWCSYLVESSGGDLLLVNRYLAEKDDKIQWVTISFKVFKMVSCTDEGQSQWVEVKGLADGDALFLGDNHSMCVPALRFSGCQPNCIYYTDDEIICAAYEPHGPRDMGIFNLENGSIGTHYTLNPSHKHMPPAVWIVPTIS